MVNHDHKYMIKAFCVPYFPYIVIYCITLRSLQMSANHLEIPANMGSNTTIAGKMLEITQINQEFLRLLLHPDVVTLNSLLGLQSGVLEGLRRLTPEQQVTVASVPFLLAEFSPMPGMTDLDLVADQEPPFVSATESWQRELQGFTDRLLTCIWHAARRETGMAAVCLGLDVTRRCKLAQVSFISLSRDSRFATAFLHARLARHTTFWPDLIASAHSSDPLRKIVAQLSAIQLSVIGKYAYSGHSVSTGFPFAC
jgi:hypothetical protein